MNGILPPESGHSSKQGFPLRLFAAAFVISMATTIFSGWQAWRLHSQFEEMSRKHVLLTELAGRIMLFDEVLTMSARMVAATGDFRYEKRYDEFDPQLTKDIDEVRRILPQTEIESFVRETDEANLALVRMERQAFALAHQDKRREAMSLLTGAQYMRLKGVYAGGMEKTVKAANKLIEGDMRRLRFVSRVLVGISAFGTLLLLASWFLAIRSARSWAAERRHSEDALRRSQDALVRNEKLAVLGQVAGSVGHELRNPLGVMSNAVYFLQTVLAGEDESVKEYLEIIKKEITESERIVSDLLDSVRTTPPHPEAVGVAELVDQTLRKYTVPASVTVRLDIPATLPLLRVDPLQIHQVFRNLISNGVEAMPEGGVLEISAAENKPEGTITVSVRDSGIGMTREQLGKAFQPLFTTKARGIGLGLVVVKNLTQANGGKVQVESEQGRGAVFSVTLPLDTARGGTQNG